MYTLFLRFFRNISTLFPRYLHVIYIYVLSIVALPLRFRHAIATSHGRLERNRASARVRRQRKKDMVELYEKDVARLERGIATLKMHVWGTGEGVALADALGAVRSCTLFVWVHGRQ